jgi:hypothetical protein
MGKPTKSKPNNHPVNKSGNPKISLRNSVYMRFLYKEKGMRISDIARRYPQFQLRTVARHCHKDPADEVLDKRHGNTGRPPVLSPRAVRAIGRTVPKSRDDAFVFSAKTAKHEAQISETVSIRTVLRAMHSREYDYLNGRAKGVLTDKDRKIRLKFAKKVSKKLTNEFWQQGISFYIDAVSFAHKNNPLIEARKPPTKMWRKKSEGLKYTCKGKKEGSGGKMANFLVAIAYNKGVILCEQYEHMDGEFFQEFAMEHFPTAFKKSSNPKGKLFLQDGDPSQNSAKAKKAFAAVGCSIFAIPARSPDFNPIENIFNNIRAYLKEEVERKKITKENYVQFSARVKTTIEQYPLVTINKTIDSMMKRMRLTKEGKGSRTKY